LLVINVSTLRAGTISTVPIVPTTTLAAETGNNTSAANSFAPQTNGNIGASNISKVPLDSLLYPGSNTLLWAHLMGWFGQSSHMNVGYTSNDPAQVHNQVTDAMSRGLNAFVEDWYGPSKTVENDTALALKSETEARGGQFFFGLVYDGGALNSCHNTPGCDLTQQAIKDLTYAYNTFETSPAYVRMNGRPVVMFFNPDRYGTLNWPLITSSVAGNPLFIFENSGGFTHASSSGSFAWVQIDTSNANDWEQSYLDSFFTTAQSYPAEYGWAATYKGFNDSLAGWGTSRTMNQNCGQTWLNTFNEANKYWSSGQQLEALQLVTWNDYEEGSELESGIDNCVTIAATVSGPSLSWSLTSGVESTIDHYTVFISTDGQNLMSLGDVAAGTHTFRLGAVQLAPATYTLYVKAVGKPTLTNNMSAPASYTVNDIPPTANLSVTPTSGTTQLTVTADASGSTAVFGTIASSVINFGDGTSVAGLTATHVYTAAGAYTVTATVTDNFGMSGTSARSVIVSAAGVTVTSPTASSGTLNSNVNVVASATSGSGITAMRIYLDYKSVYLTNGASLNVNLAIATGQHNLTVQAWDGSGAVFKNTQIINVVDQAPVAKLTVSPSSAIAPVTVTASTSGSYDPDGSIASTTIDFGDGAVVSGASATHTYSQAGTYTVKAILTDNVGGSASATQTVTVNQGSTVKPGVTVTAPLPGSTVGSPVQFLAQAASANPITAMRIYVDHVGVYTVNAPQLNTYLGLASGIHNVTVQAWDSTGAVFKNSFTLSVK
jgi:PKD repeat protein